MKILAFILSLLLTLSLFGSSSNLQITTNSKTAMIFIDNEYFGDSSVSVKLDPGDYIVDIYKRKMAWNNQVISDTIHVTDNDDHVLNYEFNEEKLINTVPSNAKVFSEDKFLGFTPVILTSSLRGNYLKIKKENYFNFEQNYNTIQSPIKLNPKELIESTNFTESTLFKVLLGTTVVLGSVAAYYKLEADEKFREYERTGNRALLNDVDKYDIYSGVSLGLLQVNFGYLIYRFLFD
jgi:hypothetical protein